MTRFSGMSWNGGTKIFGEKYSIRITEKKFVLSKNKLPDFPFIIPFAVVIDLVPILIIELPNMAIEGVADISPFWARFFIFFSFFGMLAFDLGMIYYLVRYILGSERWHGLEHKLIAAAEKGDIENTANYSPINDRCGGTYMLSMLAYLGIALIITTHVIGTFPFGILTIAALLVVAESRVWHQYNTPGIRFGRWLQQKFTVREPSASMIQKGIIGMKYLLDLESGAEQDINTKDIQFG